MPIAFVMFGESSSWTSSSLTEGNLVHCFANHLSGSFRKMGKIASHFGFVAFTTGKMLRLFKRAIFTAASYASKAVKFGRFLKDGSKSTLKPNSQILPISGFAPNAAVVKTTITIEPQAIFNNLRRLPGAYRQSNFTQKYSALSRRCVAAMPNVLRVIQSGETRRIGSF